MDNPEIHNAISDSRSEEDRKVDAKAVLVIFTALVLGALLFVSGWSFDLGF